MNQAQQILQERQTERHLESERHTFEQFVYRRYLSETQQISSVIQTEQPVTIQGLCWRIPDGAYGVAKIDAAWLGWKARAMYQLIVEQATAPSDTDEATGGADHVD